jgi:hypothetical protein
VPEAERHTQIDHQQEGADETANKRDVDAQSNEVGVLTGTKQSEQRGDEERSTGNAADEKVENDPPPEVGR